MRRSRHATALWPKWPAGSKRPAPGPTRSKRRPTKPASNKARKPENAWASRRPSPFCTGLRRSSRTARQQAQALHDSEQELVKLAVLIALQVVHRELRQDPSVVLDTVRAGIERLRRASRLTLHVSSQDFQFLEEHMEVLRSMAPATTPLSVEPDPTIAQGGCRIVSNTGEVDATVETAVHKLIERVWGEHHPAEGEV